MDEWQHALGTQGGFDPFSHLSTTLAKTLDRDTLAAYVRDEHWRLCGEQPLLPGVRERIHEARALSLRVAVASSSPSAWVHPWLERHDLMPLLDAVCTRDDVQQVKPAPDLFLLAAERMNVDPGVVPRLRRLAERPARRIGRGHEERRGAQRPDPRAARCPTRTSCSRRWRT